MLFWVAEMCLMSGVGLGVCLGPKGGMDGALPFQLGSDVNHGSPACLMSTQRHAPSVLPRAGLWTKDMKTRTNLPQPHITKVRAMVPLEGAAGP